MISMYKSIEFVASDPNGTALDQLAYPPPSLVLTSKTTGQTAVGTLTDRALWLYQFRARDGETFDLVPRKDGSIWYKNSLQGDVSAHVSYSSVTFIERLHSVPLILEADSKFFEPSTSGVNLEVPQLSPKEELEIPKWLVPIVDKTQPFPKEWFEDSQLY